MPIWRAISVGVTGPASNSRLYTAYSSGRRPLPASAADSSVRSRWFRTNTSNSNEISRCDPAGFVGLGECFDVIFLTYPITTDPWYFSAWGWRHEDQTRGGARDRTVPPHCVRPSAACQRD